MNLQTYLTRIGINEIKEPSPEFLSKLQNRHLLSIPFEDLDIPDRARIETDLSKIYSKIIKKKRGGFCYELNGLFHWLLTELGFNVDMLSARVFNPVKNELGPEFDHLVLLVHLDKDYIVDVGFGDSFRKPIELPDGSSEDISGFYKVFQNDNINFELKKKSDDGWQLQYSFNITPRIFSDFNQMCAFQQDNPSSHFRTRMLCTIATETGRITLSNNSIIITDSGKKSKIDFTSEEEFYFHLKKYFDIELS